MKEDDDFSCYFRDALTVSIALYLTDISRAVTAAAVSALGGAI